MRLDVGPVTPFSAGVWIEWAHRALADHADRGAADDGVGPRMLQTIHSFLGVPASQGSHEPCRWHADVDPDVLEYVAAALFDLEPRLPAATAEGRAFHVVLVRDVLRCLELESPSRAAFADQLRWSWPSAMACR